MPKIKDIQRVDGKLPAKDPEGRPVSYFAENTGGTYCAACAGESVEAIITYFNVNLDDPELFCDGCGRHIEAVILNDVCSMMEREKALRGIVNAVWRRE